MATARRFGRNRSQTPSAQQAADRLRYARESFGIEPEGPFRKLIRSSHNILEVRRSLSRYDPHAFLEELCSARYGKLGSGYQSAVVRARLAREAAVACSGRDKPTEKAVRHLARQAFNAIDLHALKPDGTVDLYAVSRIVATQFALQANPSTGLVRIFGTLQSDSGGAIGADYWKDELGFSLPKLVLGSQVAADQLNRHGVIDAASYIKWNAAEAFNIRGSADVVIDVLRSVAVSVDEFREIALELDLASGSDVSAPGPMWRAPVIEFAPGTFGSPSPEHVRLLGSPAALYIRMVLADSADRSRVRTSAAGENFTRYLGKWVAAETEGSWSVVDLDEHYRDDEHADLLVVCPERKVALVVEAKTTLQAAKAMRGDLNALKRLESGLYQKAMDQIDATVRLISDTQDLDDLTRGCQLFGLVVTLDVHPHIVRDEITHAGLPLDWTGDLSGGAKASELRTRLIEADDFETLVSVLARLQPSERANYMTAVFDEPNTLRSPSKCAQDLDLASDDDERKVNEYSHELFGLLGQIESIGPALDAMLSTLE